MMLAKMVQSEGMNVQFRFAKHEWLHDDRKGNPEKLIIARSFRVFIASDQTNNAPM